MTLQLARRITCLITGLLLAVSAFANTEQQETGASRHTALAELGKQLRVGDVVFIHVTPYPFRKVSEATQSWVNHVGVVTDVSGPEAVVSESTFPISRTSTLSRFVARSEAGRVAVARLDVPLTDAQAREVAVASKNRLGRFYDTGFNLNSRGEYCSRFVREVLAEATGVAVGEVETFGALLARNPDAGLGFWRVWFFGNIPWDRQTVTPASLYRSNRLRPVFDGYAA
jgi:hypothetical protein